MTGERLQLSKWKVQNAESASVTSRTTMLLLLTNLTSIGRQSSVVFPAHPWKRVGNITRGEQATENTCQPLATNSMLTE
jgi:hypothetical protein